MKNLLRLLYILMILLPTRSVYGQLSLSGEIRPRFELRDGYRLLPGENERPAAFIAQRNRLGINLQNNYISTSLSLQNILVWGSEPLKTNLSSFGLHEAWIKIKIADSLFIKSGRQELIYDNQRLLSNNNWVNTGQKHDIILFQLIRKTWHLDAGFAFNQESEKISGTEYNLDGNYKYMNFVLFSGKFGEGGDISILTLNDGFQSTTVENQTNFRFTYGGSYRFRMDVFDFYAAGYLQNGKNPGGMRINAWYGHLKSGFSINSKLRVEGGLEVFSGKDYTFPGDNRIRSFEASYGAGHGFNGSMDYFTIPDHTRGAGLVNPYISMIWEQGRLNQLKTDVHMFSLQNNYVFQDEVINKHLGTEVDITFSRSIANDLSFSLGYSIMLAGKSMEIIKGGSSNRPAHWGFAMLTYKPEFL
jgi:hypothetical protein